MKNYIKIGENLYRDSTHRYIIKICEYCGKEFYCRNDKILKKKTCNSECHQKLVEKNNLYTFDKKTLDILTGSLLSDGCITKGYNAKNYHYTHFSMHEEYIDYLISEMNIYLYKQYYKPRKTGDGKYMSKGGYYLISKYSVSFTEMRKLWYPEGTKIVPSNLELNPTILLHWYLGDGNIGNENGIELCTDSFDENSMDILLEELYKLNFLPHKNKFNRIDIPNKRVFEFLEYIGKSPVECFNYKWNTIVKKSYKNRICLNCGSFFDTEYNHKIYCSNECSIKYSNKNGNKLKEMKKFI